MTDTFTNYEFVSDKKHTFSPPLSLSVCLSSIYVCVCMCVSIMNTLISLSLSACRASRVSLKTPLTRCTSLLISSDGSSDSMSMGVCKEKM